MINEFWFRFASVGTRVGKVFLIRKAGGGLLCFFMLQPDYSASDVHSSPALLAVTVLFLVVMIVILIISATSVKESLFVLTLLHRTPPLCSCVTCFPVSLLSPPPSSFILSPGASPHLSKIT